VTPDELKEVMCQIDKKQHRDLTEKLFALLGALVSIPLIIILTAIIPIFWEGYP